jgi:hypothetical protein
LLDSPYPIGLASGYLRKLSELKQARSIRTGSPNIGEDPDMATETRQELRNHPLMSCGGICNWPPAWTHWRKENKIAKGEVGILRHALQHEKIPEKCFLVIDYEMERYVGSLGFDDVSFCAQIHDLLQNYCGRSIKEIGDLDLSTILSNPLPEKF